MEQSDDEIDEPEPQPVSIAVHAETKDGSGAKEFHLQVNEESLPAGSDHDKGVIQSSTTLEVSTDDPVPTKVLLTVSYDPL